MPLPIEITILGSGSAIPTLRRKHTAILLKYEGDYMLFDCGEAAQLGLQKANVSPMKIKRIFISHWHADHFAGLLPLIETLHMLGRQEPLEVYGPEASWFIEKILDLSYWSFRFQIKAFDVPLEEKEKIVEEKKYEIFSIPVKHSVPAVGYIFHEKDHWKIDVTKVEKLGIPLDKLQELKNKGAIRLGEKIVKIEDIAKRIEGRKVVYSGDTLALEELFKEASRGLLIHDATFIERVEGIQHASVREVCTLAKKYKVKKLVLTHFSRRYETEEEIKKVAKAIFPRVIIARDGKKIKF
jgi:ribonuclease Z